MTVIVDTGTANIASVCDALDRLGAPWELSARPEEVAEAERVIFPGVGAAAAAMARLEAAGLDAALRGLTVPVLGICLGMQLLFGHSEEGDAPCLGILPGTVRRLDSRGQTLPHIGWNRVRADGDCPLLRDIPDGSHFYFVHSYRAPEGAHTVATTRHGEDFPAIVRRGNIHGTQFHPEKSAGVGAQLLRNFLAL